MNIQKKAVDLTDLAIGIIVLGIVVSIGGYMLITYRDSRLTDSTVATTTNESLTFTSGRANLANTWCKGVTGCTNTSGLSGYMNSGNYSVTINDFGTCIVSNLTTTYSSYKCTYTWYNTTTRTDYGLADDAATGIGEYGNWFKIIVIVGVAAVVLAIIFMSFGRKGTTGGSY